MRQQVETIRALINNPIVNFMEEIEIISLQIRNINKNKSYR